MASPRAGGTPAIRQIPVLIHVLRQVARLGACDAGGSLADVAHSSRILLGAALGILVGIHATRPTEASVSNRPWAVPEAVLKFTVEVDPNRPPVPSVPLSAVKAKRGPSDLRNPDKGGWSGSYLRMDGQTYKQGIALSCPRTAVYPCKPEYRTFVALVGLRQDADPAAAVSFEVYADKRKLFSSAPVRRTSHPVGIEVRIPHGTKELRLETVGADLHHRRHACWMNAGFLTKRDYLRVGHITLPTCGYDPSELEVVVFTFNGIRVGAEVLRSDHEQHVEALFFAGQPTSVYHVYLVPKGSYEPPERAWQPDAGLVLETRRVNMAVRDRCKDIAGLREVWNGATDVVGYGVVQSIHHGHPVHPRRCDPSEGSRTQGLTLYRYRGYLEATQAGQYTFATASKGGSHLLIDGKEIVAWPGDHDHGRGMRGQRSGTVSLEPGAHRIEYWNYSPRGTMLTLGAWKPPGGRLGVITRGDFPGVRGFVVRAVESRAATPPDVCFTSTVVDDWRLDRDKPALILVRFQAVPEAGADKGEYRWQFDDGILRTGEQVDRVFSIAGSRRAVLQHLRDGRVLAQSSRDVYVGTLADKIWVDPRDRKPFEREIGRADLQRMPLAELVNLHSIADGTGMDSWTQATRQALIDRASELIGQRSYHAICLKLIQFLSSPASQQYDRALTTCMELREATPEKSRVRQEATVRAGELLVRSLGAYDRALSFLNQARWEETRDETWTVRLGLVRAEALLGLGRIAECREQIERIRNDGGADAAQRAIRHAGLLRRVSQLAAESRDMADLNAARDDLFGALLNDPGKLLAPTWNLARLDLHVARGEYTAACLLAQRLGKLEMTPYDRAQVLLRHVNAACAAGDLYLARKGFQTLSQVAPESPEILAARRAIMDAVAKTEDSR